METNTAPLFTPRVTQLSQLSSPLHGARCFYLLGPPAPLLSSQVLRALQTQLNCPFHQEAFPGAPRQ